MNSAIKSPHYSSRREITIDTIVIHATATDNMQSVINWFTNPQSKTSAHYVVGKSGSIIRLVDEKHAAWHVGKSYMPRANLRSVGVELVNKNDGIDEYTEEQIRSLKELIRNIMGRHRIVYLVGHYEIARPVGRKSDPRNLNMQALRQLFGLKGWTRDA